MDDLRLLRVLREVALRGSFSAAAESLSYTQPAVSQQIARLERQIGVRLVDRDSRRTRLTPAGEVLVRRAERIFAEVAAAEAELGEIAAETRGRLCVAAFPTAAGTVVPGAVAAFRRLRPAVDVRLEVTEPPDAVAAVRRGEVDIAMCEECVFGGEVDAEGLGLEVLLEDPFHLALPRSHPLAARPEVDLGDLAGEDWVICRGISFQGDGLVVLAACRDAGFEPRVVQQTHDYFAVLGLVASGMGVALVPRLALVTLRDDVVVRPVAGTPPLRRIGVVTASAEPAGAQATMLLCLREAAQRV